MPLKAGAYGSRIVVTTRNENVASSMGAVVTHSLQPLSDEDCWSLFAKLAFKTSNSEERSNLRIIGKRLAERCKGLPLAAKALGGFLCNCEELEQWRRMLNGTMFDLPSILHPLISSYYHLSSYLKLCFHYCSIFPKGYRFEKQKLIFMWMGEGFLEQPGGEHSVEDVGEYYFSELLSRSFFQPSSHKEGRFVMHDLHNLLAQFVSGEFCSKFEDGKLCRVSEKTRHFAYPMDLLVGPEQLVPLQE